MYVCEQELNGTDRVVFRKRAKSTRANKFTQKKSIIISCSPHYSCVCVCERERDGERARDRLCPGCKRIFNVIMMTTNAQYQQLGPCILSSRYIWKAFVRTPAKPWNRNEKRRKTRNVSRGNSNSYSYSKMWIPHQRFEYFVVECTHKAVDCSPHKWISMCTEHTHTQLQRREKERESKRKSEVFPSLLVSSWSLLRFASSI